ncbi:PepSY domain-containing protein [Metabacillus sp. JX24]|uniref:PepSY domain-containing protein n=1 Tax=Metabacillus sp. JX24 TaxID=3240759 RepID=UPI00351003AF
MPNKWTVLIILVLLAGAASLAVLVFFKDDPLTEAEARTLVNSQYSGTITSLKETRADGEHLFIAELEEKGALYSLSVDAEAGKIKELKKIKDFDEKRSVSVTKTEAKKIAEEQYQGEIESLFYVESEQAYSIRLVSGKEEISLKIDSSSGKILSENRKTIGSNPKVKLTEEQAIEIARKEAKGEVGDLDLEEEDGRLYYEIEIENGENETTVQVDAFTGAVLSVSVED